METLNVTECTVIIFIALGICVIIGAVLALLGKVEPPGKDGMF